MNQEKSQQRLLSWDQNFKLPPKLQLEEKKKGEM